MWNYRHVFMQKEKQIGEVFSSDKYCLSKSEKLSKKINLFCMTDLENHDYDENDKLLFYCPNTENCLTTNALEKMYQFLLKNKKKVMLCFLNNKGKQGLLRSVPRKNPASKDVLFQCFLVKKKEERVIATKIDESNEDLLDALAADLNEEEGDEDEVEEEGDEEKEKEKDEGEGEEKEEKGEEKGEMVEMEIQDDLESVLGKRQHTNSVTPSNKKQHIEETPENPEDKLFHFHKLFRYFTKQSIQSLVKKDEREFNVLEYNITSSVKKQLKDILKPRHFTGFKNENEEGVETEHETMLELNWDEDFETMPSVNEDEKAKFAFSTSIDKIFSSKNKTALFFSHVRDSLEKEGIFAFLVKDSRVLNAFIDQEMKGISPLVKNINVKDQTPSQIFKQMEALQNTTNTEKGVTFSFKSDGKKENLQSISFEPNDLNNFKKEEFFGVRFSVKNINGDTTEENVVPLYYLQTTEDLPLKVDKIVPLQDFFFHKDPIEQDHIYKLLEQKKVFNVLKTISQGEWDMAHLFSLVIMSIREP